MIKNYIELAWFEVDIMLEF